MVVSENTRYRYHGNYMISEAELISLRKTTDLSDDEIYETYGFKIDALS